MQNIPLSLLRGAKGKGGRPRNFLCFSVFTSIRGREKKESHMGSSRSSVWCPYWKITAILFLQFHWKVGQALLTCYLKAAERSAWPRVFPSRPSLVPATPTISKTLWGPLGAVLISTDWTCSHAHLHNLVPWCGPCSACHPAPRRQHPVLSSCSTSLPKSLARCHFTVFNLNSHMKSYLFPVTAPLTTILASRLCIVNNDISIY